MGELLKQLHLPGYIRRIRHTDLTYNRFYQNIGRNDVLPDLAEKAGTYSQSLSIALCLYKCISFCRHIRPVEPVGARLNTGTLCFLRRVGERQIFNHIF